MNIDEQINSIKTMFNKLKERTVNIDPEIYNLPYFQIFEEGSRKAAVDNILSTSWLLYALKKINHVRNENNIIREDDESFDNTKMFSFNSAVATGFLRAFQRLNTTLYYSDILTLNNMPKFTDSIANNIQHTTANSFDEFLLNNDDLRMTPAGEMFFNESFLYHPEWFENEKELLSLIQCSEIQDAAHSFRLRSGIVPTPKSLSAKDILWSKSPYAFEPIPNDGIQIFKDKDFEQLISSVEVDIYMDKLGTSLQGNLINNMLPYINLAFPMKLAKVKDYALSKIDFVGKKYPNFQEATNYIREHVEYLISRELPLKLPNLLLIGHPGVGKSAYISEISKALDIPSLMIPMASISTAAEFSGLSGVWGNGQQGLLAENISKANIANPIIMLDEIDKTANSGGNCVSPKFALLSITEKSTAKEFMNPYYKINMDLSHISWIATANDTANIDHPLLTRFKKINIPSPNKKEFSIVANSIYSDLLSSEFLESEFSETLCASVIDALYNLNLRDVQDKMRIGLYRAYQSNRILDGKKHLSVNDIADKKIKRSLL